MPFLPFQVALGALLTVSLFIGLWSGRGVKTVRDYALANQELAMGVISITFLATFMGMDFIRHVNMGYKWGIMHLIQLLFWLFGIALLGRFVLPKLVYFQGAYTLGGVVRQLYGKKAAWFVSSLTVLYCFFFMGIQIVYMGKSGTFVGLSDIQMICLLGFAVICYTVLGGIRTVTSTDVLQLILVIMGITVFAQTLFAQAGDLSHILADDGMAAKAGKLQWFDND